MKIEKLKEEIQKMTELRRTRYGNIRHKLEDIIVIGLCTAICGGEDFTDKELRRKLLSRLHDRPMKLQPQRYPAASMGSGISISGGFYRFDCA